MSIYKRGETWWISFTTPDGKRVQKSAWTRDKKQAEQLHDKLKAESWKVKKLGEQQRRTWAEAVVKYIKENRDKKSLKTDKYHFAWLDQHLRTAWLDQINRALIDEIIEARLQDGVSNASVNRVLATIKKVLNAAKNEWEWIETVPSFKMLKEPSDRVRWLTVAEADRLLKELPEHLRDMAEFSLSTGLRESNVTGLKWSQIDMAKKWAWIPASHSKSGKPIPVPLNTDAIAVLRKREKMRSVVGIHIDHVFTFNGNPVQKAGGNAWRKALKRARISDFRWHDLRHTWATWHIQNGTPIEALMKLGGWSSIDMVLRYAHLSSSHLAQFAENVES